MRRCRDGQGPWATLSTRRPGRCQSLHTMKLRQEVGVGGAQEMFPLKGEGGLEGSEAGPKDLQGASRKRC